MAGRSIGTIFAELDLDPSRYMKAQKNMFKEAQQGADILEKNFRNLGIKSAAHFDLLRARAEQSFERIKNSNQVTANDIVRAERAKNEQLKRINEQQFGSQKSLIDNLKEHWVAAIGAIVSAWYTVRKAFDLVKDTVLEAARYETLGVAMNTVGRNAGYSAEEMAKFQKGLEDSGIAMTGARQALTRMAQAQVDLSKSAQLARIAQDTAVIGAMNSTEAFNNLVYGIQTANVRVLRTIGINVSWEESYKKVAQQLGRTTDSFTTQEKAAIRLNAVIEAGEKITGTYEAAMNTAGKRMLSLQRYVDNLKAKIGEELVPYMGELVDATTNFIKSLNPQDIKFIADSIKILADAIFGLGKAILSLPQLTLKLANAMETEVTVLVDVNDIVKQNTKSWLEYSRALNEAEKNYLALSVASGQNKAPSPSGIGEKPIDTIAADEITKKDKEKLQDLTDFWRVQYEQRYEIQADALQRMIENDAEQLQAANDMKKDFWQYQIQDRQSMIEQEIRLEMEKNRRLQLLDIQASNAKLTIAKGLGTALLGIAGANNQAIFVATQAFDAAMAIISGYAAGARALAELGPIAGPPVMAQMISLGYLQAAAIAATTIGQLATSSSTGGGTYVSPTVTTQTTPISNVTSEQPEEQKGTVNIYVEGAFVGSEKQLAEYIAEIISDNVEKYDVRLVASHAKIAERTA